MNSIFNFCVDLLYYLANMFNCSYEEINVIIFCFAWPLLTILLIIKIYVQKNQIKV